MVWNPVNNSEDAFGILKITRSDEMVMSYDLNLENLGFWKSYHF